MNYYEADLFPPLLFFLAGIILVVSTFSPIIPPFLPSSLPDGIMAQVPVDEEKVVDEPNAPQVESGSPPWIVISRLNDRLASLKFFEARGIERVLPEDRHNVTAAGYMQMTLLWFSTNITANNMAVGMLGPLVYGLGFVDSALCATFGALLGAVGVGYMGTFGPASGNRTMVCVSGSFLASNFILVGRILTNWW